MTNPFSVSQLIVLVFQTSNVLFRVSGNCFQRSYRHTIHPKGDMNTFTIFCMAIHPVVVEMSESGLKRWTDICHPQSHTAGMAKNIKHLSVTPITGLCLFLSVSYHCKWNALGFWTAGPKK